MNNVAERVNLANLQTTRKANKKATSHQIVLSVIAITHADIENTLNGYRIDTQVFHALDMVNFE